MVFARVIGRATATMKHHSMEGWKLLLVQPLTAAGNLDSGDPFLAVDILGAGAGDNVMISSDGQFTSEMIGEKTTPVRWSVIAIVDGVR